MTQTEKLTMLKTLLGMDEFDDSADTLLEVYLDASKREILAWRYSFALEPPDEVPTEYEMVQIYAVIAGYGISGAENQTEHSENGIRRIFKYEDMIAYIRAHVLQIVKVMG